jgi:hypothetical protein
MKRKHLLMVLACFFFISNLHAQWIPGNTLSGAGYVSSVAVSGSTILAGSQTGGVYISNDYGVNWTASNTGLTNLNDIVALEVDGSNIFAGAYNSLGGPAVFLSQDGGASWSPTALQFTFVFSLTSKPNYLVAGTWYGVSFTNNNGTSWSGSSPGLPSNASVCDLAYHGTKLFAAVCAVSAGNPGVYASTNDGSTWAGFNTGLTNINVNSLAAHGSNIFVGTNSAGVFRSPASAPSWTAVNTGITSTAIKSLYSANNLLFAGCQGGISVTMDDGASWVDMSIGLPAGTIVRAITSDSLNLYIGTDSVVYYRPWVEVISGIQTQVKEDLLFVFPNPATESITIKSPALIRSYEITNHQGQLVAENKNLSANESTIDIHSLTKGIYFISIVSNGGKQVRKFSKE